MYIYICPVSSAYVQFTIGVTIKVVCIVRVKKIYNYLEHIILLQPPEQIINKRLERQEQLIYSNKPKIQMKNYWENQC